MTRRLATLLTALVLIAAACGGGEGGETTTAAPTTSGVDQPSATAAPPPTTAATVTGNADDDFCEFIIDYAASVQDDFNIMSMSPQQLEAAFKDNLAAIEQAQDLAPGELRDDVGRFADAYGGFIDFLDEYDFNFLAITEDAFSDPRLQAMEDPALEEAGMRIEEYCGIENFITPAPTPPSDGGTSGLPGAELPEGFPSELEPPGGVVVASVDIGGSTSVTFDTPEPADDVIEYYTDVLGAPAQQLEEPKGALWTMQYEGTFLSVVVADLGEGTQVNVSIGG